MWIHKKNNKIQKLIQVTKSLKDEKTKKRELSSFAKTIDELKLNDVELLVISEEKSTNELIENRKIKVINILEWLIL